MDRAPNGIQRHLLPWDRPLLRPAADPATRLLNIDKAGTTTDTSSV